MKYFGFITLIFFLFIVSCSSGDNKEERPVEETGAEETVPSDIDEEEYAEDEEEPDYDRGRSNDTDSNQTPKIKRIVVNSVSGNIRDGFVADITAEDPEGGNINYIYQWKHNDSDIVGATEDTLSWSDEFKKGDKITIEVIPYDEFAQGIWRSEGSFTIPNSPPSITSQPSGVVSDGRFTYNVQATDPDEDKLNYSLKDAPEGMEISEAGEITWQYGDDHAGDYNVVIIVSDGDGGETYQELTINVESQS